MPEITHADLMAIAARIEDSTRREVDQVRGDVKEHFRTVHARVDDLCDRVERSETALVSIEKQVVAVRHDYAAYVGAGETFKSLLDKRAQTTAATAAADEGKPKASKMFIAGVTATIVALAGVAELVHELIKRLKP